MLTQPEKFQSEDEPWSNMMDAQGSTGASAIKDYVVKHSLRQAVHRRPLVAVCYSVDLRFDYRVLA